MKILLPVDGSPFTKKMLQYVLSKPALFAHENHYTLLTVVPPLLPQAVGLLGKTAADEYYKETAKEALDKSKALLEEQGFTVTSSYKIGYVGEVLPEEADKGAYDLVVMGSHGHGVFGNLVLGSVANAMLSRSKIPVLLIR